MAGEEKLVRKVSLDWLNFLHGSATSFYASSSLLINSSFNAHALENAPLVK
jgi:hypothetical protein